MEDEVGRKAVFICMETPGVDKSIEKLGQVNRENGNFFVTLKAEMENDPTLRDLIIGQFIYKPRAGISCPEFIRYMI